MLTEPTVLPAMMVRSVGRHGDGGTVVVGVMVVVVVGGGRRAIVDCCFCALSLSKLRVLLSSLSRPSPSIGAP